MNHDKEWLNEDGDHFTPEERQRIRSALRSPRLNERYHIAGGHISRWRLMQATLLLFAIVVAYSFYADRQNQRERREEQCELLEDSRAGVRALVEGLLGASEGVDDPENADRIAEVRRITREALPPVEFRDGECVVIS